MRLLVTGAAGFVGRHVLELARSKGYDLAAIDIAGLGPRHAPLVRTCVERSISREAIDDLVQGFAPQVCVHLAGRASVPDSVRDPAGDFDAGVTPTVYVLDALRRWAPACRFVLASSAAVYGNPDELPVSERHPIKPVSPYGFHKAMTESLCLQYRNVYGLDTASVRIFSAYGEGLRRQVVYDIFQKAAGSDPVVLQGSRLASRDFVHVRDVAAGLLHVAEKSPMNADIYNLGSGVETSIEQLAAQICDVLGRPKIVAFDGAVPKGTPMRWQADVSKLSALGFTPRLPLADGLLAVANWLRADGSSRV